MHSADRLLDAKEIEQLRRLEESLWLEESRYDPNLMEEIFAPDFFEFGRSGRVYPRSKMILDKNTSREIKAKIPLPDFRARHLSDDIVQITYVSEVEYPHGLEKANRSSIWSRRENGWQLRFHQGTAIQSG